MKYSYNIANEPKTRKSALQLAMVLSNYIDNNKTRKENLMISKNQAERKLTRLQKTLEDLEKQIQTAETAESTNQQTLERLMNEWQLTQAEILESKSALLRGQLKALEKEKILASSERNL